MRGVVGGVAATFLAVGCGYCADDRATHLDTLAQLDAGPTTQQWLFFAGTDAWYSGIFAHGGFLWSPSGLDQDGLTLKLVTATGTYHYRSGALGVDVRGFQMLGSVMPGWRFKTRAFELTAYAGLDLQEHQLSRNDPGNPLHGAQAGLHGGFDLWSEPTANMMVAANASASTVGPTYWSRLAAGWRLFDAIWLGPEVQALGGPNYRQLRVGAHATAFRTESFEWSAGVGFATDSDGRNGAYGRLGVLVRR